jgi:hypothetical protein
MDLLSTGEAPRLLHKPVLRQVRWQLNYPLIENFTPLNT